MTGSPRVLLVDNEPELLHALIVRLSASGFVCEAAENGAEALEHIDHARPDLLVADLLMPKMDGYTLLQQLRAHPQHATIPVIVLTAVPAPLHAPRADALQGAQVIQKPFDSAALVMAVRAMCATTSAGGLVHG